MPEKELTTFVLEIWKLLIGSTDFETIRSYKVTRTKVVG